MATQLTEKTITQIIERAERIKVFLDLQERIIKLDAILDRNKERVLKVNRMK